MSAYWDEEEFGGVRTYAQRLREEEQERASRPAPRQPPRTASPEKRVNPKKMSGSTLAALLGGGFTPRASSFSAKPLLKERSEVQA